MKLFSGNKDRTPIPWDAAAEKALENAPMVLRSMVRSKVEKSVREAGRSRVRLEDFQEAEGRYRSMLSGKAMDAMKHNMPQPNVPGTPMVHIATCHSKLAGCQNPLMDMDAWKEAVEQWVERENISERLRERVKSDRILFHNKLKISLSGCPNGCSRPQIADFGIVGCVSPGFDLEACTGCGQCAGVCPDHAITLEGDRPRVDQGVCQGCFHCHQACPAHCVVFSRQGARLLAGGKLGRHPQLGKDLGAFDDPAEMIAVMSRITGRFITGGEDGERFADFCIRTALDSGPDRRGA